MVSNSQFLEVSLMKATRRGLAAAMAALALLVGSVVFRDFVVEVALLVLLIVTASEAVWVRVAVRKPEAKIILRREGEEEPGKGKNVILYPGKESVERIHMTRKIGGKIGFESRVSFLRIEPNVVAGAREATLDFRFKTQYAGEYSAEDVGIDVTGPMGLFSAKSSIPLFQRYSVYPRLYSVALATIKLLARSEIGETPIEMPGVGSEYYEMREYQPGDDFRSVNWKATARQGELIVIERMKEVAASFLLVLDARAPGFYDTDRLASTFLSMANTLASAGVSFGVMVHDGSRVTAISPGQDPRVSLSMALKAALSITKLDSSPEFLELVPVRFSKELAAMGTGLPENSSMVLLSAMRREEARSVFENVDPWATASNYVRDESIRSVLYVSGVFGDLEPLIELAWQSRLLRDADFMVVNPCGDGATEEVEDRDRLRLRDRRVTRALQTAGVRYYRGEPLDLAQRVLSA